MNNFQIKYRPGNSTRIRGADALSRTHESVLLVENNEQEISRSIVKAGQSQDAILNQIIQAKQEAGSSSTSDKKISTLAKFASITPDGLLIRYVGPRGRPWGHESLNYKVWIPKCRRDKVLNIFHTDLLAGHLGIRKTHQRLEDRVYWEGMRADAVKFVKSCVRCQESMLPKIRRTIGTSMIAQFPWEIVSVDLMGPYPKGAKQSTHMLVLDDNFSVRRNVSS